MPIIPATCNCFIAAITIKLNPHVEPFRAARHDPLHLIIGTKYRYYICRNMETFSDDRTSVRLTGNRPKTEQR